MESNRPRRPRIYHTVRGRKTTTGTLVRHRLRNILDIRAGQDRLGIYLRDRASRPPRIATTEKAPGYFVTAANREAEFYEIDRDARWPEHSPSACVFPSWNQILATPAPGAEPRQFWSPRRRGDRGGYRVFEEPNPLILRCPGCFARYLLVVTATEGAKYLVREAQKEPYGVSYRSVERTRTAPKVLPVCADGARPWVLAGMARNYVICGAHERPEPERPEDELKILEGR